MIWLNPAAAIAIVLVAAPLLIHLLVHRRAERFAFPTLRFVRPTRLAAIRRHVLEDILLLAVRAAIIVAAVAAFAGPLVIGGARRAQWNARTVRAVVIDDAVGANRPTAGGEAAFRAREFRVGSIADGIHRAIQWLDDSPPARRELVVAGPLTIGSIHDADLAAVPAHIGIRFERIGPVPPERTVDVVSALTAAGTTRRTVTLAGPASVVRTAIDTAAVDWPVEIVASPAQRPAVDAAMQAVLSQGVLKPATDRPVKVVVVDGSNEAPRDLRTEEIRTPWMADAIARVMRDPELQDEAASQATGLVDTRLGAAPWRPLAIAADGRAVISAAASQNTLVIVSGAAADALVTPLLLRSIANSIAPADDPKPHEILQLSDRWLLEWTRPPGAVIGPRVDTIDRDDRRWLWVATLALLAVETWMRRARRQDVAEVQVEASRVA